MYFCFLFVVFMKRRLLPVQVPPAFSVSEIGVVKLLGACRLESYAKIIRDWAVGLSNITAYFTQRCTVSSTTWSFLVRHRDHFAVIDQLLEHIVSQIFLITWSIALIARSLRSL